METEDELWRIKSGERLQEARNEMLARLIEQYWDLLDMMMYGGYIVNWERLGF